MQVNSVKSIKNVDKTDYLLINAGLFSAKHMNAPVFSAFAVLMVYLLLNHPFAMKVFAFEEIFNFQGLFSGLLYLKQVQKTVG